MRLGLPNGIKVILVKYLGDAGTIKFDRHEKRVFWSEYFGRSCIKSCDYGGKGVRAIACGKFQFRLLGVFGGSVYLFNTHEKFKGVNKMNVSNGNLSQAILVNRITTYNNITVEDDSDKSLQLSGKDYGIESFIYFWPNSKHSIPTTGCHRG